MKMKLPWEENETTTFKRHVIGECNWLQITLGAWTVVDLCIIFVCMHSILLYQDDVTNAV